jgi:hypothetical protein
MKHFGLLGTGDDGPPILYPFWGILKKIEQVRYDSR